MKKLYRIPILLLFSLTLFWAGKTTSYAKDIVVVLDPGHGGENEGGKYGDYIEKEITIKVAEAMKEELEKYQGIKVYMTREEDRELSLKERVDFAKAKDADFIYCLHFNMSEYHTLYGAECWTSAFGSYYAKGQDFAKVEMEELTAQGLFDRGIKTRIGKKGDDYYGIIRHATAQGIPAVIIEHCHMDHEMDAPFLDTEEWPATYGRLDATAVAKYYGLKSEELGIDYSGENRRGITDIPESPVKPDNTEPEECFVESYSFDDTTGILKLKLTARDSDCRMLYYTYSLDGGSSYESLLPWPKDSDSVEVELTLPENTEIELVMKVHNLFDLEAKAEPVKIAAYQLPVVEEIEEEPEEEPGFSEKLMGIISDYGISAIIVLVALGAIITSLFVMVIHKIRG